MAGRPSKIPLSKGMKSTPTTPRNAPKQKSSISHRPTTVPSSDLSNGQSLITERQNTSEAPIISNGRRIAVRSSAENGPRSRDYEADVTGGDSTGSGESASIKKSPREPKAQIANKTKKGSLVEKVEHNQKPVATKSATTPINKPTSSNTKRCVKSSVSKLPVGPTEPAKTETKSSQLTMKVPPPRQGLVRQPTFPINDNTRATSGSKTYRVEKPTIIKPKVETNTSTKSSIPKDTDKPIENEVVLEASTRMSTNSISIPHSQSEPQNEECPEDNNISIQDMLPPRELHDVASDPTLTDKILYRTDPSLVGTKEYLENEKPPKLFESDEEIPKKANRKLDSSANIIDFVKKDSNNMEAVKSANKIQLVKKDSNYVEAVKFANKIQLVKKDSNHVEAVKSANKIQLVKKDSNHVEAVKSSNKIQLVKKDSTKIEAAKSANKIQSSPTMIDAGDNIPQEIKFFTEKSESLAEIEIQRKLKETTPSSVSNTKLGDEHPSQLKETSSKDSVPFKKSSTLLKKKSSPKLIERKATVVYDEGAPILMCEEAVFDTVPLGFKPIITYEKTGFALVEFEDVKIDFNRDEVLVAPVYEESEDSNGLERKSQHEDIPIASSPVEDNIEEAKDTLIKPIRLSFERVEAPEEEDWLIEWDRFQAAEQAKLDEANANKLREQVYIEAKDRIEDKPEMSPIKRGLDLLEEECLPFMILNGLRSGPLEQRCNNCVDEDNMECKEEIEDVENTIQDEDSEATEYLSLESVNVDKGNEINEVAIPKMILIHKVKPLTYYGEICIRNNTNKKFIFKVLTTKKLKRYCVKPVMGYIPAVGRIHLIVNATFESEDEISEVVNDSFIVLIAPCHSTKINEQQLKTYWKLIQDCEPNKMRTHKIDKIELLDIPCISPPEFYEEDNNITSDYSTEDEEIEKIERCTSLDSNLHHLCKASSEIEQDVRIISQNVNDLVTWGTVSIYLSSIAIIGALALKNMESMVIAELEPEPLGWLSWIPFFGKKS